MALPTETVYGLAANALDARAVDKIFAIKGRPSHNPLIVHVASLDMARSCASEWPSAAEKLAKSFWPGPLTLVLPKAPSIPDVVTAGGPTVAIRWPNHPVTQAIIQRCGFPLAAPSANLSGQVSPTTADHVRASLGAAIALVVDGGPADIGLESTVLDLSVLPPAILRPGMIDPAALEAVVGPLRSRIPETGETLRGPGLLLKHYAPKARLVIWSGQPADLESWIAELRVPRQHVHLLVRTSVGPYTGFGRVCLMPLHPRRYAQVLYSELHKSDDAGAQLIVVEAPPGTPEWQAINDRLQRAAA